MKKKWKWLGFAMALAAAKLVMPFESSDVAQLVPVEALVVTWKQGQVRLEGGDCCGVGASWNEAIQDLKQGAKGKAFLATVEQVVLCADAREFLMQVARERALRPAAVVCVGTLPAPDPKEVAQLPANKKTAVTLQQVCAMEQRGEKIDLPVLANTQGGLRLYGP